MKIPGRQDLLPLVGLALAIVVLFSSPLTRIFSYARQAEEQSGLAVLPALVVLAASLAVHLLRRRYAAQTTLAIADVRRREVEVRAEEVEHLVAYGQALGRANDLESIRVSVAQHLPTIAGTDRVWVLIREGTQWEALAGDTRGTNEVLRWGDLAEQLLSGQTSEGLAERAIGFPLMVDSAAIGVLGVRTPDGALGEERRRAIEASAPVLALAIRHAQLAREVRENSVRDALTGCFTRGHAIEVIDAELRRARRSQAPVSLIMFDVDRLKDVNDRHGHLGGDAVLAVIGKRMREVLRGSDLKCRYAGEQFLVLLPETPLAGAKRVAETLRREVADRPVPWAGENLRVTASFGLAQALAGEVNVQALIGRADHALYRAKDEGGNCVRIADATVPQPASDQP
ncbi:MAG TPA: GGDEF domain-containing protein [Vicinamibacterales bacterium]|nr:GGDEF domain-containing protein [Vicinamibacterales bacterium]